MDKLCKTFYLYDAVWIQITVTFTENLNVRVIQMSNYSLILWLIEYIIGICSHIIKHLTAKATITDVLISSQQHGVWNNTVLTQNVYRIEDVMDNTGDVIY